MRVRSMALPGYKSFPLGLPDPAVAQSTALTPQATCLRCWEGDGARPLRLARDRVTLTMLRGHSQKRCQRLR